MTLIRDRQYSYTLNGRTYTGIYSGKTIFGFWFGSVGSNDSTFLGINRLVAANPLIIGT